MFALSPLKASMTDSAALAVSAKTTPTPWVPSSSLMTKGAPPHILISSPVASVWWAKPVTGRPMPRLARIWSERSLSRERAMATESLSEKTFIISNCRTTALP